MTTWHHYPLSHPWMSSLKRKLPDSPDDSDHESPPDHPNPQPKRRRFDLARNLSRLSLFEQIQGQTPIVQEPAVFSGSPLPPRVPDQDIDISVWSHPQQLSGDTTMDMDGAVAIPVVNRSIVEEPIEPPFHIPQVHMRHTSSYEPEKDRIVVTDLDSSEDESETPLQTPAASDRLYSVSHAFLSRVNPKFPIPPLQSLPPKLESSSSQALVLFKPSPWSAKDAHQLERLYRDRDEERIDDLQQPQIETPDPDAMEIE